MNFKALALGLLTTVATVAPVQAGQVVDGYQLMDESDFTSAPHARIVKGLNNLNVPVIDGGKMNLDECQPLENGSYRLGFYVPSHNIMVLCTNNGDEATMNETLTHESVHVIQDIRAGFGNGEIKTYSQDMNYLASTLSEDHVNIITNLYPEEQWEAEIEARAFQTNPVMVGDIITKTARNFKIRGYKF